MCKPTKDTAAICGLFCGICPAYPKECGGCLSDRLDAWCAKCPPGFRDCAKEKGHTICSECDEYASCARLRAFNDDEVPHHTGVLKSVERQKKIGVEAWLEEQIKANTCQKCGALVDWEREDCQNCGHKI